VVVSISIIGWASSGGVGSQEWADDVVSPTPLVFDLLGVVVGAVLCRSRFLACPLLCSLAADYSCRTSLARHRQQTRTFADHAEERGRFTSCLAVVTDFPILHQDHSANTLLRP
jgi:hypothetical protein